MSRVFVPCLNVVCFFGQEVPFFCACGPKKKVEGEERAGCLDESFVKAGASKGTL